MFEYAEELREILKSSGDKQLTELAELLEMQEELDKAILEERGITRYPEVNIRIALSVELREMLNELPTLFKFWKKTAEDNREKALVEYVDALHFAMSMTNNDAKNIVKSEETIGEIQYRFTYNRNFAIGNKVIAIEKYMTLVEVSPWRVGYLFNIGRLLDFTWDEIYKAYKDKNAVNYQRLKEGY